MKKRLFVSGSMILTLVLPWGDALAQAEKNDEQHTSLNAIVVNAKAPEEGVVWETDPKLPRQPVPASDGADYLKTIPGFTAIRNGGSNGDPVLRGLFGSRLNLLSNGGSMPGACPSRMDNPMSYVAPETFDRLVVVKGPQTVLWGPGASAGTVRFERDTPRFDAMAAQVQASALTGSNGRHDTVLDATAGGKQGYARVSGNTSRASDYRDGNGDRVPSAWDKWNADAALGWTPDAHTVLELGLGRGDGEARYAGRRMDGSQFDRDSTSLRLERTDMQGVLSRVEASAYRNAIDHVMDNYSLRNPNPQGSMPMPMASNVGRLTKGGRVAVDLTQGRWRNTLGLDAQNSQHRKRAAMGKDAYLNKDWESDAWLQQRGVFVESTLSQTPYSQWVLGGRFDQSQATDQRKPAMPMNPHQGGVWEKSQADSARIRKESLRSGFVRYEWKSRTGLSGFAGFGQTERMPDYWELFSPTMGPMGSADAFAGVAPERTRQWDAGLNYRHAQWEAWLNAYRGRINDYILFLYPGSVGSAMKGTRVTNIDADIHGSEMGVTYRWREMLTVGGTLAWAWGANRDAHTALPQMPPLEGRFNASWQGERWSMGLLWRLVAAQKRIALYQGNVVGQDLGESRGFGTLALNASARLSDTLRLAMGVDNVFDRAYSEHLNLAGSADFGFPADPVRINEPGRNLWLKLDFSY